jgi:hypothetical protein
VFALSIAASSGTSAHFVDILGGVSCVDWSKQRPKTSKALEAWVLGYFSGMAQQLDVSIPKTVTPDSVLRAMDQYCKDNPKKRVEHGAYFYFGKLNSDGLLK